MKLATTIARLQATQGPEREVALKVAKYLLEAGSRWSCSVHPHETPSNQVRGSVVHLYCALCEGEKPAVA